MELFSKPLFILEMANNHNGKVEHGLRIIRELQAAAAPFRNEFHFAVKFQYRDLDTFIHPAYRNRSDLKFVKRFSETRLTTEEFMRLKCEVEAGGFFTVCTAFDEKSVHLIESQKFSAIKIASCSFTDWPLLEQIAKVDLPIIASTAGIGWEDIDKVTGFFVHRKKQLCLMHCVAEYPTAPSNLQLNQIGLLKRRFPLLTVGYSTHEEPDNLKSIGMAIAKGACIFEKHTGIPTPDCPLNLYSASPEQIKHWLDAARESFAMCGQEHERHSFSTKEMADLHALQRGVFTRKPLAENEKLDTENIFYAIPTQEGQLTANDMSKYKEFVSRQAVEADQPLFSSQFTITDIRSHILEIVHRVRKLLVESGVILPEKLGFDLSHHYGIENFEKYGATILNLINRDYTKKIVALIPGQNHPEHHHKIKEETFTVLYGDLQLRLKGEERTLYRGDMVVIERGADHSFTTRQGVVFEEISTRHYVDDSYYSDPAITRRKQRKTEITHWADPA